VTDKRTDGQTHDDSIYRASIALRGIQGTKYGEYVHASPTRDNVPDYVKVEVATDQKTVVSTKINLSLGLHII